MVDLPGWLTKRARDAGYTQAHVLLAPSSPTSAAIYLLEGDGTIAPFELHVVSDALSGIDGATVPLSRREATNFMLAMAAGLSHRVPGQLIDVPKAPVASPVEAPAPETVQ